MPVMGLRDEMEQALSCRHCYKDWYNDTRTGCRLVQPNGTKDPDKAAKQEHMGNRVRTFNAVVAGSSPARLTIP